jgi:hypothetical protein
MQNRSGACEAGQELTGLDGLWGQEVRPLTARPARMIVFVFRRASEGPAGQQSRETHGIYRPFEEINRLC